MPPLSRLGDQAFCPADAHGAPGDPRPASGPAISGSPTVLVNGQPALRVGDNGIHTVLCSGPNTWVVAQGSSTVFIDGQPAARLGDTTQHCGGVGTLVQGSPNVIVGG